jgi:galactofuranosylgalactofuranosylrhamnosyl-N-acetylglucosaminyl-diphospho-decaprenol beta-1,5/1,6-galactofuranosyltransferase
MTAPLASSPELPGHEVAAAAGPRVLQRVVFPGVDPDVVPLYVETNLERGASELASELAAEELTGRKSSAPMPAVAAAIGEAQSAIRFGDDVPASVRAQAGPRRSAVITEGRRVSFGTYFNAFPASYWRRWTTVESVTLRIRLAGESTVVLYRSTARGHGHPVETIRVESGEPVTIERALSLAPFIDGGWYWFDIAAGPQPVTLIEAEWVAEAGTAPSQPAQRGRVSVGITTFNRPDDMLHQLRTISEATDLHDLLDTVYVIDQGSIRLVDQPGFAAAASALGEHLEVIEQGNLGGSGGFARSMDETVSAGKSDYVLLMDDDVQFDPEGLLRAVAFADLARRPTIVGGHMFSRYDRCVMHAYAESVAAGPWWWGAAPNTKPKHDFGHRNLRNTPWLHRRADSDYNGWWMCLIPTRIIGEIGLALPVFIKWDDAEYGLRARARGYPTVSMPGVASWQAPWDDKDDSRDWQAYYHLRNRLVTALLHSPVPRGGTVIWESLERQLQSVLSMKYSTAALQLLAVEDVLAGPGHLHRDMRTKRAQLAELRQQFSDAVEYPDIDSFPPARRRAPEAVKDSLTPTTKRNLMTKALAGTMRQFRPPRAGTRQRPQMVLPYQDASWFVLVRLDSAVVSSAEGTSAVWFRRDPRLFRSLMRRSVILHYRLRRRWPRLAAQYREAAAEFTSPGRWRETFEASVGDRGDRVILLDSHEPVPQQAESHEPVPQQAQLDGPP